MKIQWEPSCSMWLDRQTDMMKIMDAFVNTPRKNEVFPQQAMKVQRGRRGIALLFL